MCDQIQKVDGRLILPASFPRDAELLREAQTVGTGADIHARNKAASEYEWSCKDFDRDPTSHRRFWAAVEAERRLRGVMAEARCGRTKFFNREGPAWADR